MYLSVHIAIYFSKLPDVILQVMQRLSPHHLHCPIIGLFVDIAALTKRPLYLYRWFWEDFT